MAALDRSEGAYRDAERGLRERDQGLVRRARGDLDKARRELSRAGYASGLVHCGADELRKPPYGVDEVQTTKRHELQIRIAEVIDPFTEAKSPAADGQRQVNVRMRERNDGRRGAIRIVLLVLEGGREIEQDPLAEGRCFEAGMRTLPPGADRTSCALFSVPARARVVAVRWSNRVETLQWVVDE